MRRRLTHSLLVAAMMTLSVPSFAFSPDNLNAQRSAHRETSFAPAAGHWSVGVFNPLSIQISDDWSLRTHPLAFLAAPHLEAQQSWITGDDWALRGVYGLAVPSWATQFEPPFGLRGYLAPLCLVSEAEPERGGKCEQDGWVLAPKLGAQYSRGSRWVLTVEADLAVGVLVSGERPRPLDTYAPLELLFAPMTHQYRAHAGARVSGLLSPQLVAMAEVDLYRVGAVDSQSPWTFSLYAGLDWLFTRTFRATAGVIYWNDDQGAMVLTKDAGGFSRKEMVRSHDVYPTFDLIWAYD